ncbi:MAG: superoxide dismutase family protein [Gammaproteobacteria bacterium]|nr:superoxide dismutase family protein [Gammaproteobacteria bacterium]
MKLTQWIVFSASLMIAIVSYADVKISVPMSFTVEKGVGKSVGFVEISPTKNGLLFTPHLKGLTPGLHGFHIHEFDSCQNNGTAAGGHFDPNKTGKHLGPDNENGHLGDLPVLTVDAKGEATTPVLAPRIKHIEDIRHRSLMIHEGGDNYSDEPAKSGGGGGRMVCGVITQSASK